MNKWFLLLLSIAGVILLGTFANQGGAADGQAIFESLHCGGCHKPDAQGPGSSLQQIARGYEDSGQLTAYLEGNSEPIIEPKRQAVMRGQLKKMAKLSSEEKQALADYILSFK